MTTAAAPLSPRADGAAAAPTGAEAVRMEGISKAFGGVQALREVDFSVRAGEIHALIGENGAGKSTILKILQGVHAPDAGRVWIFGEALREATPQAARRLGVAMIFQEMSLIPTLNVAQNVFLGRETQSALGLIDDAEVERRTARLLEQLQVRVDPRARVDRLSTGQRQLTEIAKALSQDARVLILDEPTSALSTAETELLFGFLRRIRARGVAVIYVSHRMEEIFAIADRVTVLRDGRHVITAPLAGLTMDTIIQHIVGRRVQAFAWKERAVLRTEPPLLEVEGLSGRAKPTDVSLRLYAGEVLGIAGLMGSGRSELARALAGMDSIRAGEIRVHGREVAIGSPRDALAAGIALIPEDRVRQGLVLQHSVAGNICLPVLDRLSRGRVAGMVDESRARGLVADLIRRLRIKTPSGNTVVRKLSGGNQQKVVLAKWLAAEPRILVLDEPTAGVDIGSKAEIVELIRGLADAGKGILLISSELAELLAVSDRLLVMHAGRIVRAIDRPEIASWSPPDAEPEARIAASEHGLQRAMQQVESRV